MGESKQTTLDITARPQVQTLLYTEADQIVHARALTQIVGSLTSRRYVIPHRFIPMPAWEDFTAAHETLELIRVYKSPHKQRHHF